MINFKYIAIFFYIALFSTSLFCGNLQSNLKTCRTYIISKNNKINIDIELAMNRKEKNTGLMFRKELEENKGMLFVYKSDQYLSFWMKNTYIPLSIAYCDKDGVIKQILQMKPLDISVTYPSMYPVRYALEMNQGWFKRNKITIGDRINLNGCFRK